MSQAKRTTEQTITELLNDDEDLDEYGEWTDEAAARVAAANERGADGEEYGSVKLRQPIDMQTLCASKGQILELDQRELDPAELARAATQMAMDEVKENQHEYKDPFLNQELKTTVSSKDLFQHRLIDNTQEFDDQVKRMKHLIETNGEDGIPLTEPSNGGAPGGIWKQTIYAGVGETPSLGSTIRIHYNAYFELGDEPYDSTVSVHRLRFF